MLSEQEFLKQYDITAFERPSVTADIAVFTIRTEASDNYRQDARAKLSLLLIRRGAHPFLGAWALPGGFLQPGETVEQCAMREITEETGVTPAALMPVGVFSEPGRDPRGWIISNVFASILGEASVSQRGGDDAADARWFDISFDRDGDGVSRLELTCGEIRLQARLRERECRFGKTAFDIIDSGGLAFDHAQMIATALTALREDAKNFDSIFDFLPETFTLSALQQVQETIGNISVLPANFRRKVMEYVEETDRYTQGFGHRPAKLYRRKKGGDGL